MKRPTSFAASSLLAAGAVLSAPPALAGAYALHEFSAVSQGRSHAATAWLPTAEVLFYNPAGLADLEGFHASIGGALVTGGMTWEDPAGEEDDAELSLLQVAPSLALTYRIGDRIGVGAGLAVPYGLTLEWPSTWAGEGRATTVGLEIPQLYGGLGVRLTDRLDLGLAFHYAIAKAEFGRVTGRNDDGSISSVGDLTGDGTGMGFGAGLGWRPLDGLHVGFAYKNRIKVPLEGEAVLGAPDSPPLSAETVLWTPDEWSLGVGFRPSDSLYVEVDGAMQDWTMVELLDVSMASATQQFPHLLVEPQEWGRSWLFKLGVEHRTFEATTLRGGLGFETSPIPDHTLDATLPDSDRLLAAVGATWETGDLAIDGSAFYVHQFERDSAGDAFDATYAGRALWLSLQLRYATAGED